MLCLTKDKLMYFKALLPYGVVESWEDLNPRLYLAIHVYWLKFYGMWYNDYPSRDIMFWLQIMYTALVLCLVCFLPGIGEVVYLLKRRGNIADLAEGLYLFLSEMYTYFKIFVFWMNKNKIYELMEYLSCEEFKPKEKEHRNILYRSIRKARSVMTAYSTMCVGAVSVAIIMPLTEGFDILPTNVEYPFIDVYTAPAYTALYIHHIYYKPATCIIDGAMDTVLAAFVVSAIGQIEILAFNLRNLAMLVTRRCGKKGDGSSRDYHTRVILRECIVHHISIIKYVSMIESAFSLASALQFMLSVMVLCLVGIQFLSVEEPTKHPTQVLWILIYLSCMLTEIFILCWFGDELIWKSMDLRQAAFDSPWISMTPSTAKYIIVFLERCQRPLRVTAGKIFTLSLSTYTDLINWSYKAFAVMRSTRK